MSEYSASNPKILLDLLEEQHQQRDKSGLFKRGTFEMPWRSKVGYFPHPDGETITPAGEPCGRWKPPGGRQNWRAENKRNLDENLKELPNLPLNGYFPASSIRGVVRNWVKSQSINYERIAELLGEQSANGTMKAGKIQFLDAYPETATQLTLDIANPQQDFQVKHQGTASPFPLYTLGNGKETLRVNIAIRGVKGATPEDVNEVWDWVQKALCFAGVGGRTASGYGNLKVAGIAPFAFSDYIVKTFDFHLYSQGCSGINTRTIELRPSHWRGWLRSWVTRFFLGVMSPDNAEQTVNELFGSLNIRGSVRLWLDRGNDWEVKSRDNPYFYLWKGKLNIAAPLDILEPILLPIIKFAVMVGGVGKGWRRPLHIVNARARGSNVLLATRDQGNLEVYKIELIAQEWDQLYQKWLENVREWKPNIKPQQNPLAETFSPASCAVYLVPGCQKEPIDRKNNTWPVADPLSMRGEGLNLIYQPQYKLKPEVGGKERSCSWVSIKRVGTPTLERECHEIVCLFLGGNNTLRRQFLQDLAKIDQAVYLFGVKSN